jgi:cell cycle sensor histidine kinase DivJ
MRVAANGEVLEILGDALEVLGMSPSALFGQGWISAIHVQDRVAVLKALGDCSASGIETTAEFRFTRTPEKPAASGGARFLLCAVPGDPAAGAGKSAVAVLVRDITARRRSEEGLRKAVVKAEEANFAKSRFLAHMSHELRTPLNAILGFSELMLSPAMGALPEGRQEEYLRLIHASARHLLNVVNDILDMSKMEAGKYEIFPEPFDLGAAVRECHAMMRAQAEAKRIRYRLNIASDIPELFADSRALRQIVLNLLSNAIKFTDEEGEVTLLLERAGGAIKIVVIDKGIGISAEHLANLGKPFYQADSKYDRKYEGTGLGLSLVRGLVELHGGRISIASVRDRGTTVTVELPLLRPEIRPVPAREAVQFVRRRNAAPARQNATRSAMP